MSEYKNGMIILSPEAMRDLSYRLNNPSPENIKARKDFFDNLDKTVHIIEASSTGVVAEIDNFDDSFMDKILGGNNG